MDAFFQSLSALEKVYLAAAVFGGSLFAHMPTIQLRGAGDQGVGEGGAAEGDASGVDGHVDGDVHADGDAHAHDVGDPSFKVLSVQGISAFSLVAGLTGLGLIRDLGLPEWASVVGATLTGAALVAVMKRVFRIFLGFRASGTLDLNQALAEEGEVYLGIPAGGEGQVQIAVQGRLRVVDATADDGSAIPTGTRVRVVDVVDARLLRVVPSRPGLAAQRQTSRPARSAGQEVEPE